MDKLVKLNNQSSGRDKLFRHVKLFLQYKQTCQS